MPLRHRYTNWRCDSWHLSHSKTILFDFDAFGVMVPIASPMAVLLSVVMGVGPCCMCPNSSKVCCIGIACLQLKYNAASSASDAEDMTCVMMEESVCMAPLLKSLSLLLVSVGRSPSLDDVPY